MAKQEILPPIQALPTKAHDRALTTLVAPRTSPGDLVNGYFVRRNAERQTETFGVLAQHAQSEAQLFEAEKELTEAFGRRMRALANLHELPEALAVERATRRAERSETLRQAQNRYEVAEVRRLTELAQVDAVLVDAQQALQAQREYGYTTYELAWRKKYCEMLDVELGAAERLAILRQHDKSLAKALTPPPPLASNVSDEAVDESLYTQRSELAASGLDTSRIDSLIERRKARK